MLIYFVIVNRRTQLYFVFLLCCSFFFFFLVTGVSTADSSSSATVLYSYQAPSVTSILPLNYATAGGSTVTITGSNFYTQVRLCSHTL